MFDMMLRLLDLEAKVGHILFKGPSINRAFGSFLKVRGQNPKVLGGKN